MRVGNAALRVSRVRIRNFRCLEDVEVRVDDVTTLIGPNGVGKSTVLRALDWFFNGPKASDLADDDLTRGADGELSVEVEFERLTEQDRAALGNHVTVDSDRCIIWKIRNTDGAEMMSGNARTFPAFKTIRETTGANDIKQHYNHLRTEQPELGLPSATTKAAVEQALKTWELDNPHRLEDSAVTVTNLFGFAGQSVMSGLFDYVFVSADMRAGEEAKDGRTALIGRILERTVDRSAADEDIRKLAERVESEQEKIFKDNFTEQLDNLSKSLSDAIAQYASGRTVRVHATKQEIKPPRTQFGLSVLDARIDTPVEKQGHGFQRTLLIAALQLLARHGNAGRGNGAICLAIEEPELFQHPVQARAFASVLRTLAEDQAQDIQVAYATHSPHFIDTGRFDQVRRVTRETASVEGRSPAVTVRSASVDSVEKRLVGFFDSVRSRLPAVAATTLSEALFSHGAVLVEGSTDKAVIEGLAEKFTHTSLLHHGVSVVDVQGKSNLFLGHAILTELGIPCYVVFDGDNTAADRKRSNARPDDPDIEQKVTEVVRKTTGDNRKLLQYLQADVDDYPDTAAHARYAVFADTIEPFLDVEWAGWTAQMAQVMGSGAAVGKKNALVYLLAARRIKTAAPRFFNDLLLHVQKMVV
jgi:predicted ATP-dependent endonuclease of OLD family